MAMTVLIVEDNEPSMRLCRDLLAANGYKIAHSATGFGSYELARAHRPDLILMDIQLPDISGLEVIKWLKNDQDLKGIPIIAITAFAMEGDEEKFRAAGCDASLAKPISVHKFLETVSHMLNTDNPRLRSEPRALTPANSNTAPAG